MVFEKPVRSKICGHTFEEKAIMQMFRGGTIPCPVAGCTERVSKNDLEPDLEMEVEVKRSKTLSQTQQKELDAEAINLDDD